MKPFMVITLTDKDETFVTFADSLEAAEAIRQNAECGMGWYAEVYKRDPAEGYTLLYA
ncbi:MAG: hypothetical protein IJK25_02830 [Firmicutes bacterium]|nr:hypothetical protein [Bacillota bacterium]